MAVFEKKYQRKICLDDTEVLTIKFENAQTIKGHTEYIIKVQRGPTSDKSWYIYKRYNDFVSLHNILQQSGINLQLPPKKLIGNMDRNFIAERQTGLKNYLSIILMNPILASSLGVRRFLDPESYVLSMQEQALQHVSMALRSEVNYELLKPLPEIGWRLRKHYFLVKSKTNLKDEMLLSWVDYGPDKHLEDKDLQAILKSITLINHPYIQKLDFVQCSDSSSFIVRDFHQGGTLRDLICLSKPKTPFLKKYGNPKQVKPLQISEIAHYGYQILVALNFLHEKCIPYGHLHLGNVLVFEGNVQLLDIANGVLGLPSYYRPFFVQHKRIHTLEAIDVYCFGHVLFEMVFGHPLHESICDNLPASCPEPLRSILQSILSTESCKSGLPTVFELMSHPFFSSFSMSCLTNTKINFKLSSNLREALRQATEKIERRLKDEQKVVRHQKKIAKVQELLSTEEEMKKRKVKLKEERKANHLQKQKELSNGNKSSPRSDSPTSTSTATSAGTVTPPPLLVTKSQTSTTASHVEQIMVPEPRSALLNSICNFNKSALKAAPTNEARGS